MDLTLDGVTEQRIQREIDRGHYRGPAEVISQALDLLEDQEQWLQDHREAIRDRLDESYAQIERGEGIPEEQVRAILERKRAETSPLID